MTLTATVDPPSGAPTGTVQFFDGTALLGTADLIATSSTASTAALTIAAPAVGRCSIVAVYLGDSSFSSSRSAALVLSVLAAPTPVAGGGAYPATTRPDTTLPTPAASPPALAATGAPIRSLGEAGVLSVLLGALLLVVASTRRTRRG